MDLNEKFPSLIECLNAGSHQFFLELEFPPDLPAGNADAVIGMGPFSKTIPASIRTDSQDAVERVHLVMQRDRYDSNRSIVPVNNLGVETAWIKAFAFHRNAGRSKSPMLFKHQVNPKGELQAFAPLFYCRETRQWFHPVCPQCGVALTLCRDDALLEKRGLPTHADSLTRFLFCETCTRLSDTAHFYIRDKTVGMPEFVLDSDALIRQWKHLLSTLPEDADLPCRGCPDIDACFGPESLATKRMIPFAFYPFHMLMFPAPSHNATEFLRMISGDDSPSAIPVDPAAASPRSDRFLFDGQDRQLLEILYLKLTFLEQVMRQMMPDEHSKGMQEIDLCLDSIGVDLSPAGAGLPAYWNFNARIIDTVGSSQASPFSPIMPESPRLHFLGALWFQALLVNSIQHADTVFAEVGRLVDGLSAESGPEALDIDISDRGSVFAGKQMLWLPAQRSLPEKWNGVWIQALQLGFQLVHAGLKTGVSWDGRQFEAALEALREQIKSEMFYGSTVTSTADTSPGHSDRIGMVLSGILEKWQAQANAVPGQQIPQEAVQESDGDATVVLSPAAQAPDVPPANGIPAHAGVDAGAVQSQPEQQPDASGWDEDSQETVILGSASVSSTAENLPPVAPESPAQDSQWNDDIEETVVLRGGAAAPPAATEMPDDDVDKTVVISPAAGHPPQDRDADLAATMIQNSASQPPASFGQSNGDDEATVILNTSVPPVPGKPTPSHDDDLAATMVQGAGGSPSPSTPMPAGSRVPPSQQWNSEDDLDATMVINPASQSPPVDPSQGTADDDLAATLVETPRSAEDTSNQQPPVQPKSPAPTVPPQPGANPEIGASEPTGDDDDIMEQTIIIRSDVKKE